MIVRRFMRLWFMRPSVGKATEIEERMNDRSEYAEQGDVPARERSLARFHDGEATPAERDDVTARVASDANAREHLEWLATLGAGMRRFGAVAPAGLSGRIMDRIRKMQAEQHPLITLMPHMRKAAIAAVVLIGVGAIVIAMAGPKEPESDRVAEKRTFVSRPDPLGGSAPAARFYRPRLDALYGLDTRRGQRGGNGRNR